MRHLPDISNDTAQLNTEERACHSTVQICGRLPTGDTMITQPNPQLEARPAAPDVQYRLPIRFPGRPRPHPTPQGTRAIDTHIPNIALAGLQLLIGYEWLLAGGDKLLLGAFPAELNGMLLMLVVEGLLLGFLTAILQGLVALLVMLLGFIIDLRE